VSKPPFLITPEERDDLVANRAVFCTECPFQEYGLHPGLVKAQCPLCGEPAVYSFAKAIELGIVLVEGNRAKEIS
jgi:hypothetical protein